ncbi:hypothetical protein EYF80_059588 [Liparis tanakae]|uniref:Uncharacterized protein n=1 Tax=Liparis tanakae TaxID=230148 RepID=A0A4Z2ENU5_9TELE|nr:hypothetical protein EYF80_059588 [Liparis tanakae]
MKRSGPLLLLRCVNKATVLLTPPPYKTWSQRLLILGALLSRGLGVNSRCSSFRSPEGMKLAESNTDRSGPAQTTDRCL